MPFSARDQGKRHEDVLTKKPPYAAYHVFRDDNVRDFIKRCLIVDAGERPSAFALLKHPWL